MLSEQAHFVDGEFSSLFGDIYKKFIEMSPEEALQKERKSEIDERREERKRSILESVTKKVTEAVLDEMIHNIIVASQYEYIDKDRPDMPTILDTIQNSCNPLNIKKAFEKIFNEEIAAIKVKEEKNALAFEKREEKKERVEGAEVKEHKLKSLGLGQQEKKGTEEINPFGKPLKKVEKIEKNQVLLSKTAQAESELAQIQPTGTTEVLKKQADQKRLEKIKEFLEAEKGAEFAKGFADAELLAFPLWAILDLVPADLEKLAEGFKVENHEHRKFSLKVLELIRGIRFNKNESVRISCQLLTAKVVKGETPKQILGSILQVQPGIINQLIGDNDLK